MENTKTHFFPYGQKTEWVFVSIVYSAVLFAFICLTFLEIIVKYCRSKNSDWEFTKKKKKQKKLHFGVVDWNCAGTRNTTQLQKEA